MERDAFLNNIAARLGRVRMVDPPVHEVRGVSDAYRAAPFGEGVETTGRTTRFKRELEAVAGHVEIAGSVAEAGTILRRLLETLAPTTILTWDRAAFADWSIDWLWDDLSAVSFQLPSQDDLGQAHSLRALALNADVGITLADYAVANTGSLVLATGSARNRSVSLLPTVHIALLRERQIVDRLGEALDQFATRPVSGMPSSLHIITGPSRSADIENDLSIGVHGPAALYVIVAPG